MGRSALSGHWGPMRLILGLSRRVAAIVALALSMVILIVEDPAARSQAAQIATIAPASGRAGDRVTIAGSGFGALNVNRYRQAAASPATTFCSSGLTSAGSP